jgi:hypothetical protein
MTPKFQLLEWPQNEQLQIISLNGCYAFEFHSQLTASGPNRVCFRFTPNDENGGASSGQGLWVPGDTLYRSPPRSMPYGPDDYLHISLMDYSGSLELMLWK